MEVLTKPSALPGIEQLNPGRGVVQPIICSGPDESCLYCGYDTYNRVHFHHTNRIEYVCSECFDDPDYQSLIKKHNATVRPYPGLFDELGKILKP